mmetsp:Transcript_9051/g.23780  ORF Transcript_9051/g.23780 Transcript_9051/m.23780 type:complete len:105 (+) Transcript_9051:826-1140(+)
MQPQKGPLLIPCAPTYPPGSVAEFLNPTKWYRGSEKSYLAALFCPSRCKTYSSRCATSSSLALSAFSLASNSVSLLKPCPSRLAACPSLSSSACSSPFLRSMVS